MKQSVAKRESHTASVHTGNALGDLATVPTAKEYAVQTNQMSTLLLDEWPRTIEKTMATTTTFIKFSQLIVLFSL